MEDLTGMRFGMLTVVNRHPESVRSNGARWIC